MKTPHAVAQFDGSFEIPHEASLNAKAFAERYRKPRKPVFLDNAMAEWSAIGRITPDYLRRNYPAGRHPRFHAEYWPGCDHTFMLRPTASA